MADLRIVDAPEIPTNSITGVEKIPTGGSGNYSITLDSLANYTKTKKDLADNNSVDNKVNGVRQELNDHIEDLTNPHKVTKGQIGLGNVDNTADADKPVSNSTQAAIISAVANKADKTYVDQLVINANNGITNYQTEAQLLAFVPTTTNYTAKALDTHKIWYWNGSSWTDTGLSELDLAKAYFNDNNPLKNIELESGYNILNCVNNAVYSLSSGSSYIDLPANYTEVIGTSSAALTVKRVNSSYIVQTLTSNQNPNIGWVRRVLVSATNTADTWIDLQSDYNGGISSSTQSIKSNKKCGTWLVTNASDLPSEWVSGSLGFLTIERAGSTYKYTLTQASNPTATFVCTSGNTAWQRVAVGKLNAATNFSDEYSYFGILTNYDANNCVKTGQYTLNGTPLNIPSWLAGNTIFLDVFKAGAFYYQKAVIRQDMNQLAQRMGFMSAGVITWTDWGNPAASSSSEYTPDTSLNGKTIAWFGDSMIDQSDYPEFVDDRYGSTSINFGFSGMRATHYPTRLDSQDDMCFYKLVQYIVSGDFTALKAAAQKAKTDYSYDQIAKVNTLSTTNFNDVDVLVIAYGTNDWTSDATTVGTTLTPTSQGYNFKETMCFCIETMLTAFPHLQIVLVSPTWRLRAEWGLPLDPAKTSDNTTVGGEYLIQYVDAINDVAEKYHLPFFDFYRQGGINSFNYEQYLRDGVHQIVPYGKQYWANRVGSFLISSI